MRRWFLALLCSISPCTLGSAPADTTVPQDRATSDETAVQSDAAAALPSFARVFVIVMENREYGQIIGSPSAPYINSLARQFGLATSYFGVRHPSLPNYMALTGGATFFTNNCRDCVVTARHLVDQVADSGRSWMAYMHNMPRPCTLIDVGRYATRHNPFVHYADVRFNAARCASHVVPLTDITPDLERGTLPHFVWITPDTCADMHDCTVATGDAWLSRVVPRIVRSRSFANAVLFLVWDEGTSRIGGGGHVPLIVVSRWTPRGLRYTATANHYSLLRTIESAWRLPPLGGAAQAVPMSQFFGGR